MKRVSANGQRAQAAAIKPIKEEEYEKNSNENAPDYLDQGNVMAITKQGNSLNFLGIA